MPSQVRGLYDLRADSENGAKTSKHDHEDLQLRANEAQRVGYGFALPAANTTSVVPIVPKSRRKTATEKAA
jgi:hypothetical protein